MTYSGSCHCRRITFEIDADISKVVECNCSICSKRGSLLAFVPAAQMRLHAEGSQLSSYTFNKHAIRHQFCPVCGVAPFSRGASGEGSETFAVNVRCLDGIELQSLEIQPYDGRSL